MNFNNQKIKLSKKDVEKGLRLPIEMSAELAEMVGIHFGDGNMQKRYHHGCRLLYACNISEKQYIAHIISIFNSLFNVSLKIYERPNKSCFELYTFSKSLCQFFNQKLEVPYSPKKNLKIPKLISNSKDYLISFLGGLFDTDGCVTIQKQGKYTYPLVKICTKSKKFADELLNSLNSLDIPSFICKKKWKDHLGYDVVIRNKNVKKFFQIITSNNSRKVHTYNRIINNLRI